MSLTQKKTVLLGMSGGVDSSVAALLLKKQGYQVIGVFLKLYSDTKSKLTGECSYLEDRRMAQKITSLLNIPLITLDYENEYKKMVLNPMFRAYSMGLTPNPDIDCNSIIKFPLLWKAAQKYKSDFIATGHYARIKKISTGFQILEGVDKSKDQSYFLANLSQKDLEHTLFPLGSLTKKEVRAIAREKNFPNWNKHGTAGICFVGQIPMQRFLKQKIKEQQGVVLTPEGKSIGTHLGVVFYTIGQKVGEHNGIKIEKPKNLSQKRFYVASKNKTKNELIVAPRGHPALKTKFIFLKNFHRINPSDSLPKKDVKTRIRHLGSLHKGTFTKKNSEYKFTFSKPLEAIASGQYLVFYKGQQVIGCGEIRSVS